MANITGTAGNDTINPGFASAGVTGGPSTNLADSILGLDGNDNIDGGGGDDTIDGGPGNDTLGGLTGADLFIGGTGQDSFFVTGGSFPAGAGIEGGTLGASLDVTIDSILVTGAGTYSFGSTVRNIDRINLTSPTATSADFFGITLSSAMAALADSDANGIGGDILVFGTGGAVSVFGGRVRVDASTLLSGQRLVFNPSVGLPSQGFAAAVSVTGGAGNDSIIGGSGNDTLEGGTGADVLDGGAGNDIIIVGTASDHGDTARGGQGDDEIRGRTVATGPGFWVYLDGGAGNDTIRGNGVVDNLADYGSRTGPLTATLGTTGGATLPGGEVDVLDNVRFIRATAQADSITGSGFSERFLLGTGGADTVDAGGGTDSVRYADLILPGNALTGAGVTVDMVNGSATLPGAVVQTILNFEDFYGSDFNDSVLGNASDGTFFGNAGNDTIDGGGGYDTVRYNGSGFVYGNQPQTGVIVNLQAGTATDNWGFTDSLINIEAVAGGSLADDLTGRINPDSTNSNLRGLGGNDTLRAPALDARVVADYREDPVAVRVNLSAADATLNGVLVLARTGKDGFGGTDSYDNLQGAIGSNFGDVLLGGDRLDRLYGWLGNDTILGGGGDDWLMGGPGIDVFDGGAGFDFITFERYSGGETAPTQAVVASLLTGLIANDGHGNAESMQGGASNTVEMLIGFTFNDDLTGKAIVELDGNGLRQVAYLRGLQGNDTLRGVPGEGRYIAADYRRDVDQNTDGFGVTVNLVTQSAIDGWGNADTLVNIGSARGSDFRDSLVGDDNDNWFRGQSGTDTLIGGLGLDYLSHGDSTGNVVFDLETGIVTDDGWGFTDSAIGFEEGGGGSGNDTLLGSTADNRLNGFEGHDSIAGRDGNDSLSGHGGNDTIDGGLGDDTISGGAGNDSLTGGLGVDTLTYASATVAVFVELGGGFANGTSEGDDSIDGFEIAIGSAFDDAIFGTSGSQTLFGGAGNDTLDGGEDADSLVGGQGNDAYYVDHAADSIGEALGEGTDEVVASLNWILGANLEHLTLDPGSPGATAGTGNELANRLTGNDFGNTLSGLAGADTLLGGAATDFLFGGTEGDSLSGAGGVDQLVGEAGNDTLDGGVGNDILLGGTGDDTYYVDSGLDLVDEGNLPVYAVYGFGGTDTIISTANFFWDLYSVGEVLRIDPTASDPGGAGTTAVGGVFDNTLIGNAGTNILFGRGGSDIYRPGDGVDFVSFSTLGVTDAPGYTARGVNTLVVDPRASGPLSYDIVFEFISGRDKIDVSGYHYASAAQVLALGQNDGLGNCYFALGDGLDFVYVVGLTTAQIGTGDFII